MDDLFEAAEDPPGPVVRKAARGGFGHDVRPAPSRFFQDVQRPDEVDVGRLSRPDLVLGGEIEVASGCGLGHRSPSRYFLCVLELLSLGPPAFARVRTKQVPNRAQRALPCFSRLHLVSSTRTMPASESTRAK